jgi:hypothetical protein
MKIQERMNPMKLRLLGMLCAVMITLLPSLASAQGDKQLAGGRFGLGMRNSLNVFGDEGMLGLGAGGHFKLSVSRRVNTEWFADVIQSQGNDDILRRDYHIGWAVQFALPKDGFGSHRFVPYLMGGQCFDLTKVGFRNQYESPLVFTAAAQAGVGLSHFLTPSVEVNLQSQYMIHLGKHVHADLDGNGIGHVRIEPGVELAGHWLTTFSFTVYFLRFWNR